MNHKHKVPTLEEVREHRPILRNPVAEVKLSLSPLERFALMTTRKVGTIGFFIVLIVWTTGWLVWNLVAPADFRFDPAPAFVIWLFISNMIQLVLLPLVMVSQNLESKVVDQRAKADFEVNKKSEEEIGIIIAHLENQNEILMSFINKDK